MNSAIHQDKLSMKIKIRTAKTASAKPSNTPTTPYSPISPSVSPSTSETVNPISLESNFPIAKPRKIKPKYSIQSILLSKGYVPLAQLANTLQGSIWKVRSNNGTGNKYIVKVTDKFLHNQSITYFKGRKVPIYENILKEINIVHHLTVKHKNPTNSIIKYIDSFQDKYNYFLILEDGGFPLFDFIKECHQYITKGIIDLKEWRKFCKLAMKQMVNAINYLHNKTNSCHLDVSLENFTIQNMHTSIHFTGGKKKIKLCNTFQIKLIDFGLAEVFGTNENGVVEFGCSKYVGKQPYKSPEICQKKKIFNAASSDCWSLAVCFFMMLFGGQPFKQATMEDEVYKLVMKGRLLDVLDSWGLLQYVSAEILDLLNNLFKLEKDRLTIAEIKKHFFLNN